MSENSNTIRVASLNALNLQNKGKKPTRNGKIKKRQGLKSLQPSANNVKKLVGNTRENFFTPKKSQKRKLCDENSQDGTPTKIAKVIKPKPPSEVKIFQDPEPENQTIDKEAYELMVQDAVPEAYWEEVAEQRRLALAETLEENEKLHLQIDDLKEENRRLSAVADQVEYFASVVRMLTGEDDKKDEEKEDDGCETKTDKDSVDNSNENAAKTNTVDEKDDVFEKGSSTVENEETSAERTSDSCDDTRAESACDL